MLSSTGRPLWSHTLQNYMVWQAQCHFRSIDSREAFSLQVTYPKLKTCSPNSVDLKNLQKEKKRTSDRHRSSSSEMAHWHNQESTEGCFCIRSGFNTTRLSRTVQNNNIRLHVRANRMPKLSAQTQTWPWNCKQKMIHLLHQQRLHPSGSSHRAAIWHKLQEKSYLSKKCFSQQSITEFRQKNRQIRVAQIWLVILACKHILEQQLLTVALQQPPSRDNCQAAP